MSEDTKAALVFDERIPDGRTFTDHYGHPDYGLGKLLLELADECPGFRVLVCSPYVCGLLQSFVTDAKIKAPIEKPDLESRHRHGWPKKVGTWRGYDVYSDPALVEGIVAYLADVVGGVSKHGRGTCQHCGYTFDLDEDGHVETHDFPKPCRMVCPGANAAPAMVTKKPEPAPKAPPQPVQEQLTTQMAADVALIRRAVMPGLPMKTQLALARVLDAAKHSDRVLTIINKHRRKKTRKKHSRLSGIHCEICSPMHCVKAPK